MTSILAASNSLDTLKSAWQAQWPDALLAWSRYLQLSEPRWCVTRKDEQREQLTGSFAMIRLVDHSIVISLRQIQERSLQQFAVEILAHEIGHHVYTPADLTDNARVQARIRAALPSQETSAPLIANLYEDLLINDRLQRSAGLDIAGVYRAIDTNSTDPLWTLYMRMYEVLWSLPRASLAHGDLNARLNSDAQLGARLIRSYAKDWLEGAGRFAVLCLPYLAESNAQQLQAVAAPWQDTRACGAGGMPEGLTEIEAGEIEGAVHPAEDPDLSGLGHVEEQPATPGANDEGQLPSGAVGGTKTIKTHREPFEYAAVLRATGLELDDAQITMRYYRERALPYLIRFPTRSAPQVSDPLLEGLDVWDIGSTLDDIDWLGTMQAGPVVIPGVTTRERHYGDSAGSTSQKLPIDLYLGVDCSGSMHDPALALSYPVLAGAIIALSALRAGSRVMVALSGEPGQTVTTDGFVRDEHLILQTLTGYLGTGTTFGIHRLTTTFAPRSATDRPVHILLITDSDIFGMLDQRIDRELGWDAARGAVTKGRGGGTYVLELPDQHATHFAAAMQRMHDDGWQTHCVTSMEQLVEFARRFSQAKYGN